MSCQRFVLLLLMFAACSSPGAEADRRLTTAEVLAKSKASDWRTLDPESTLYVELEKGRVVIELAPEFASNHVANVKALAREKYFDGLAIIRVQDNYVVQWGDPNAEKPALARAIQGAKKTLAPEFDRELDPNLPFSKLPEGDVYAPEVGFSKGFPVARDPQSGRMWLVHCYGMVGAGRDTAIDSGGGAEIYVVIGHAPRHLDRNVTLFGRVVQGMDLLSALPRGPGPMGFYERAEERVPIKAVRLAADVPVKERTALELLRTDTPLFVELIESRRNRNEEWFHAKIGRIEICNVPLPVRPKMTEGEPIVLELWPKGAPEESAQIGPERTRMSPALERKMVEVTNSTRMITGVTNPTITIYKAAKEKDTGAAVLICPGGGYWDLYWELEGEEVAHWLNSVGVTGIILKYRVPRRPDEPRTEPARRPLQDAQRAMSVVRSRAGEWGIDPERIGTIGFSAGGHLAIATATSFEQRTYEPVDDMDKASARPNFAIAAYSGFLMARDKDELWPGLKVPAKTPPIFLVHGDEDVISDSGNSVRMYLELKKAGVPAELHIYANTTHDFGVRKDKRAYGSWPDLCADWMKEHGFLRSVDSSSRR
jgi:peptidylprolyl isomerase